MVIEDLLGSLRPSVYVDCSTPVGDDILYVLERGNCLRAERRY